jgi:hypothetical protein
VDLDHAADIGPITHVENATPRHPAVLVGGREAGKNGITQVADPGKATDVWPT